MKQIFFSLLVLFFAAHASEAQDKSFGCPMKKGKIVIEEGKIVDSQREPGAIIKAKNSKVFSISSGVIKAIDTFGSLKVVYIESGDYFFSYHNFKSISVSTGQLVKVGDIIGHVDKVQGLFLLASKEKVLVEPKDILRCKVVTITIPE